MDEKESELKKEAEARNDETPPERRKAERRAESQDTPVTDLTRRLARAERALLRSGFVDHGGEEWKPPVGKPPVFVEGPITLNQQLEAARNEAFKKAAARCVELINEGRVHSNFMCAKAINALAAEPAAPVQPELQTLEEIGFGPLIAHMEEREAAARQASPPVQQTGDVRDLPQYERIREEFGIAVSLGAQFDIDSAMMNVDNLCQVLATTRPSAALTDDDLMTMWNTGDAESFMGRLRLFHQSILAASGGAHAVPGWISVEDRLPKLGQTVLCFSQEYGQRESLFGPWPQGSINRAKYGDDVGYFRWSEPQNNWGSSWKPTHWMPLPAAPTTQDQGEGK